MSLRSAKRLAMKSAASFAPASPVPRPASSGEARKVTSALMRLAPWGSGTITSGPGGVALPWDGGGGGGGVIGAGSGPQPATRRGSARTWRALGVRTAGGVSYENGRRRSGSQRLARARRVRLRGGVGSLEGGELGAGRVNPGERRVGR